jgi:hypothetical protein
MEIRFDRFDLAGDKLSFVAQVEGTIKRGRKDSLEWEILNAKTTITGNDVPIGDIVGRCLTGWYWVRCIQDRLRLGNREEAETLLSKGFTWGAKAPRSPEGAFRAKLAKLGPEERRRLLTELLEEFGESEDTVEVVSEEPTTPKRKKKK